MRVRLHTKDLEDILLSRDDFHYTIDTSGIIESDIQLEYKGLNGTFKELFLGDISIRYGSACTSQPLTLDFESNVELVEMHFTLHGNSYTYADTVTNGYELGHNQHNLFYAEDIKGRLDWLTNGMEIFEVQLKPKIFEKYLPEGWLFEQFREKMDQHRFTYMGKHHFPITPQMLRLIHQIKNCPLTGNLRKLAIESKVMELLLLQLSQIQVLSGQAMKKEKYDFDQMAHAKKIILSRIENPLTLHQLAKEVGTNECSLKRDFKKAYGTTVFGFLNETKMSKAKHLLQEEQRTVKEVSEIIGYKNPQHFSVAFKKKYGIQPSYFNK